MSDLSDAVTRIVGDCCPREAVAGYAGNRIHLALWDALTAAGFTAVSVPEAYGGSGGTATDAIEIIGVVGRFAGSVPIAESGLLGGWLLANAGWDVPRGPLAVAAPESTEVTVVRREDGGLALDGAVRHVAWLADATELVLLCTADGEPLVCRLPVETLDVRTGQNIAGESRDTVVLRSHVSPAEYVRRVPTHVTRDALRVRGAATRVASAAGALLRIEELTVRYAGERIQFGRAINQFQAAQHRLARLAEDVRLVRTAAATMVIGDEFSAVDVAAARSVAGTAALAAVAEAHQLHGAIGITLEHPLNHFTRRVWSWLDEYGTGTEWSQYLGTGLDVSGDPWTALVGG